MEYSGRGNGLGSHLERVRLSSATLDAFDPAHRLARMQVEVYGRAWHTVHRQFVILPTKLDPSGDLIILFEGLRQLGLPESQ